MANNELYHHGILGQKWGKRNGPPYPLDAGDHSASENKAGWRKSIGKKASDAQVQRAKDIIKEKRWKEDVSEEVFDTLGADKSKLEPVKYGLQEAQKQKEQITEDFDELFAELEDYKVNTHYAAVSEIANDMLYYNGEKPTVDQVGGSVFMGIWEDGQQGPINMYSVYAKDNGLNDQVKNLMDRTETATTETRKIGAKIVDKALEEIGNKNIKQYSNYSTTGEAIVDSMIDNLENIRNTDKWNKVRGIYKIRDAEPVLEFDSSHNNYIKRAKKIVGNLDHSDYFNWYYLNEAAESLGLSNVPAEDLTKSDWNRLNNEMKKIREQHNKKR